MGSFKISETSDSVNYPVDFTAVFEPLQLIYTNDRLLLTAKAAENQDNASLLAVYQIDIVGLGAENIGGAQIQSPFTSTSRTRSHVIFHVDEAGS